MEVIKWAAAELYGDKNADVLKYMLQYEGKELDRYAKLWELEELWEVSEHGHSKRRHLVLARVKRD